MKIALLLTCGYSAVFAMGVFAALGWCLPLVMAIAVAIAAHAFTLVSTAQALDDEVEDALDLTRRSL